MKYCVEEQSKLVSANCSGDRELASKHPSHAKDCPINGRDINPADSVNTNSRLFLERMSHPGIH